MKFDICALFKDISEESESIQNCKVMYKIPYEWTDHIYHDGLSFDCKSIANAGLLAGELVEIDRGGHASRQ